MLDQQPGEFALSAVPVLQIAELWRKGTPPTAGGLYDQPAALTEAVRFIWSDEDHLRRERLGPAIALLT